MKQLQRLIIVCFISGFCQAQRPALQFVPVLNGKALVSGKPIWLPDIGDTVRITSCRFYISGIQLFRNGKLVKSYPSRFLLIDMEDTTSFNLETEGKVRFDKVCFVFGVDSVIQSSGAFGGNLDPSKGMYWAWQSGYIHFKLEGESPLCTARKHRFQWHLGGYRSPWNSIQQIELSVNRNNKVCLELNDLIKTLFKQQVYELMSPGLKAQEVARLLARSFYKE